VARWACTGWEIAESEVGAALTVGRHRAGVLMSLGVALRDRLPWVRAAMAAGDLDPYRAGLIHDATRNVTAELIGEVERQILAKVLAPAVAGVGLTGRRPSNAITRIVGQVDPAGVRERRRRALKERHIGVSPAEDAMVALFGSLPAAKGRKLDTRLRELANTVCPSDGRTFEQRKADASTPSTPRRRARLSALRLRARRLPPATPRGQPAHRARIRRQGTRDPQGPGGAQAPRARDHAGLHPAR